METPNLLDVTRKLYELIESTVKLPKKGAEKVNIGSESAADIKTLTARLLELAEKQANIPAIRRNPFLNEDKEHQVERALAGANAFGCKVPDVLEAQLTKIAKDIAEIKQASMVPSREFNFTAQRAPDSTAATPSYALAASKHAPKQTTTTSAPRAFKPTLHRPPPPPPPTSIKSNNTITLAQSDKDGNELLTLNYPTLITLINKKLTEANVKEKPTDLKPVQIRSVHRHPSNNIILYTTTPQQA